LETATLSSFAHEGGEEIMGGKALARLAPILLLLLPLGLIQGCSGKSGSSGAGLEPGRKHILEVMRFYTGYKRKHNEKPPANMAELKSWATKLSAKERANLHLGEVTDDTFVSPRDHKEYGVMLPNRMGRPGPAPIIIYESDGVDGEHMVVGEQGNANPFTDEQFHKLSGK
jgi:hypothetical protein